MENDLFLIGLKPAKHKTTNTAVLIINSQWYKGELLYNCLVPQKDEKGKTIMCNASYSQNEIKF